MVLAGLQKRIEKMKTIFGGAMRKAVALTSRQNLAEATRVIQHALSGGAREARAEATPANAPPKLKLQVLKPEVLKPEAPKPEVLEPEAPKPQAPKPEASKPAAPWSGLAPSSALTQPKPMAHSAAFLEVVQGAVKEGVRKAPPLGEVLQLLQKGLAPVHTPGFAPIIRPAPEVATPPGAQFLSMTHAGAAGSRDYMLYVPSDANSRAKACGLPLIVMLHGCSQNPQDFALGTGMNELAEKRGCLVVYPKQPTSANNMACWNWFSPKDQARDSGEAGIIAGIVREIISRYAVDPNRVFVAGLSAGGAMAANLAASYPDLFAAAGIHSGLPYGAASDVGSAFAAMRKGASKDSLLAVDASVRTIVFHGDADRTVHPLNAELIVAAARASLPAATEEITEGRTAGGVAYKRTVIAGKRGAPHVEHWSLEGVGHAWSGGDPEGSYTNPHGPDASREMMRFFLD